MTLSQKQCGIPAALPLCRRIQHVFNENAVSRCGVIDQYVGNRADEFAVLDDGGTGHECVNIGTTLFYEFFEKSVDVSRF